MVLQIKTPILGFESLQSVVLKEIDELFYSLHATNESALSFTVCNPYALLDEYEFEIPDSTKLLLGIDDDSELGVYCMVVSQTPIESSRINFLAPIVVNKTTKTLAQVALNKAQYPHLEIQKPISDFLQ